MTDESWYCNCTRLSPEAPVPVAEIVYKTYVPGGAGNVCANLNAILGEDAKVVLCSTLDTKAIHLLDDNGTGVWEGSHIIPTANTKLRIVDTHTGYHIVRIDNEEYIGMLTSQISGPALLSFLKPLKPDAIILSDYCKGVLSDQVIHAVMQYKQDTECPVLVDTRRTEVQKFTGSSIITPNLSEYHRFLNSTNTCTSGELIAALQLSIGLLVTKSKDGLAFQRIDGEMFSSPAKGQHIVDVTGAGDTVLAAVTAALVNGYNDWNKILDVANELAYEVCMQRGTAVPEHTLSEFKWD